MVQRFQGAFQFAVRRPLAAGIEPACWRLYTGFTDGIDGYVHTLLLQSARQLSDKQFCAPIFLWGNSEKWRSNEGNFHRGTLLRCVIQLWRYDSCQVQFM